MPNRLYVVAFIEGAAVMSVELLSGMIVVPFFGSTIVSWAVVLAITLGGLASGYYIGGVLSRKVYSYRALQSAMLLGGLFIFVLPYWGPVVMASTMDFGLEIGLIISLLLFLFPALLAFGGVSPLIIQQLTGNTQEAGKITGSVFGISTAGGIVATMLLGLYIIPEWGITLPSIVAGALVLGGSLMLLFSKGKILSIGAIMFFLVFALRYYEDSDKTDNRINLKIHHTSEGVLGQVKVIDFGMKAGEEFHQVRALLVNNTWQTAVSLNRGVSLLSYVYHLLPVIKLYPEDCDLLVIGLGGGGLIREMQGAGYSPDVVELDGRLPKLAKEYFGLDLKGEMIVDDGRHFLNKNEKIYEIVVLDVFQGEVAPWQLLTHEAFQSVHHKLKPNGLLAIEFFGNTKNPEESEALSAVVKTLYETGFKVQVVDVAQREKLILANKGKAVNLQGVGYGGNFYEDKNLEDLSRWLINVDLLDTANAPLLTDDLPVLERMTLRPAKEWRQYQNEMFRDYFVKFGLPAIN